VQRRLRRTARSRRAPRPTPQHSAGSGKSLTIAVLVHGLLRLGYVVLVVNDRLQLDAQLGETVADFLRGAARARARGREGSEPGAGC
jgi:type I site-specific restriction-modification system R (restriction) subunit